MPRPKSQLGRTDETYEVLKHHCTQIAKEYPCDYSWIHAIKEGKAKDVFAEFLVLFIPAARAGAPVRTWIRRLMSHIPEEPKTDDIRELLSEIIHSHAELLSEIIEDIGDDDIDERECDRILEKLEVARDIHGGIARLMRKRKASLAKKPGL